MTTMTDAAIKRLPARATAYRHFEGGALPGFHLQIQPSGSKTFYLQVTRDGQRRFYRIGVYPAMPLAAARERARELLSQIEQGVDPRTPASGPEPTPVTRGTTEELLQSWIAHQIRQGRRNAGKAERYIRFNLPVALLEKPAADITPADIRDVLVVIHQRGRRAMADLLQGLLRTMFRYGLQADHDPRRLHAPAQFGLTFNPVDAIPVDSSATQARDRVLSWDEIRRLWQTNELSWPVRQVCRLLLLTGARVNEVARAPWSEFDLSRQTWLLPVARSKTKHEQLWPLTPWVLDLLAETRVVWPKSRWLFPSRHLAKDQPYSETSVSKAVRDCCVKTDWTPAWQPRDLRRTFKTLAGEVGLSLEIRNRIQGHVLPDVGSRHYDRYAYQNEKRTALLAWETALRARVMG